jgi:hypothetical protein
MDVRTLNSAAPPSLRAPSTRAEQPEKARKKAGKRKRPIFKISGFAVNSCIKKQWYNRKGNRGNTRGVATFTDIQVSNQGFLSAKNGNILYRRGFL